MNRGPEVLSSHNANDDNLDSDEEKVSQSEIEDTKNKAKENSALGKVLGAAAIAAVTICGVMMGITTVAGNNNTNTTTAASLNYEVSTVVEDSTDDSSVDENTATNENSETESGIIDGYDEVGMWERMDDKGWWYDFASAKEVAKLPDINNKVNKMIEYTAGNQVESFADYIANLPEDLQLDGFNGSTILDAEKKLESLTDEEFEKVKERFNSTIDRAFTRDVVLHGGYHNAYMQKIDSSKPAAHDNMELVKFDSYENGTGAIELYWTDDNTANGIEVGTMAIKIARNKDGEVYGGCMQVVNPIGSNDEVYQNMKKITDVTEESSNTTGESSEESSFTTEESSFQGESSEEPSDITEESSGAIEESSSTTEESSNTTEEFSTPPVYTPKNIKAEIKNAGDNVDQQKLDETKTPATTIDQDRENFRAIEEQLRQDAERLAEAERKAKEQAAAERRAAEEAEKRRQEEEASQKAAEEAQAAAEAAAKAATEAAARAQAAAEAAQRAAAEAERQAAAERAARERAQAEADARAAEQAAAAARNADATAQDRANLFANGDF